MIGFFDTNIFIDYLKGVFPKKAYEQYRSKFILRMCPVVYQELIRCIRSDSLAMKIEKMTKNFIFFPPPTNLMWVKAGRLAGKVMGSYDKRTLEKIQNDLLIALTAQYNGAILNTQDKHFKIIQKHLPFRLIIHQNASNH